MKISLNWLKDYVVTGVSPDKLAHKLTMAGLEVEKITSVKGDKVFELEITPNRPDCLNMLGIARETAAILNKARKIPKIKKRTRPKQKCSVEISDKKGCSRYIGALIENVAVKKAGNSIAKRLNSIGLRSINNVVDITNFCLMETGQPLHAFDYDKLVGGKIIVRRARKGEKIITLDDVERKLDPSILVIADAKRPVAIAGIMGGRDTQVTNSTKNILLESAYFDSVLIRRASRKLGLTSDSAYRFERGVDFTAVADGANRAIDIILNDAGGRMVKYNDKVIENKNKTKRIITISRDWANNYAGANVTAAQFKNILTKLGFQVTAGKNDILKITVPTFRSDVIGPVDIVEEISRVIGYDNLDMSLPHVKVTHISDDKKITARRHLRGLLLAQGLNEAVTFTMINNGMLKKSGQANMRSVAILNPLTQDQEIMRPSLLPSLMSVVRSNVNRGQKDLKIFEIGKVYSAKEEKDVLGIVLSGLRSQQWHQTDDVHQAQKQEVNYYDAKGIVEQVLERSGVNCDQLKFESNQEQFYAPGQGALMTLNGKQFGSVGKVEERVLEKWDIKQGNVFYAQVDLKVLYKASRRRKKYKRVSEFPTISRDISLAAKKTITAADIQRAICETADGAGNVVLSDVQFVELHEGRKIPGGHRGLIFSLTYQSRLAKTLRDDEVEQVHNKVCSRLIEDLGVIQR